MKTYAIRKSVALAATPLITLSLIALSQPSVSAEPRQAPAPGDCYLAAPKSLDGMSNPFPSVDCSVPHNLETYYVTQWRHGDPYEMEEDKVWSLASEICSRRSEAYLDIKLSAAPQSRLYWYYFFPTPDQWTNGERWISCDIGLRQGWTGLQTVSEPMRNLMARQGVLGWAYCTKGRPSKYVQQAPAPCSSSSRPWILAKSTKLKGTVSPGEKKAGNEAAAFCKLVAQRESSLARPNWLVWWSSPEEWQRDRAGFAWCYMDLAETRWR